MIKAEGSAKIVITDSRTNVVKQTIEQKNIIPDQTLADLITGSGGIGAIGANARISLSTQTTVPDKKNNILTGIIATGYIPAGISSPALYLDDDPPFGQIQNRIDYINVERTFTSVGLTDRSSANMEPNVSNRAIAYLLLDTVCTQGLYDYVDIFYRIQFLYGGGQGFILPESRRDFAMSFFGQGNYGPYGYIPAFYMNYLWVSPCSKPTQAYTHLNKTKRLFDPEGWVSHTKIASLFKLKSKLSFGLDSYVGIIFNMMLQGGGPSGQPVNNVSYPYTSANFLQRSRTPFQNMFSHASTATKPFFDSLHLANGNGKVILDGNWTGAWPEMYKISIVSGGATGTATYKWSVRKHLGFQGNTYLDDTNSDNRAFGNPFRNYLKPAISGLHGWRQENIDVHKYSSTQIWQYDDTGGTLLDLVNGNHQNWDATTTPALPATQIRQCAVDEVNKKIYVGCRQTGLWVIDPVANTVTHPVTENCYGIDVGLNNIAIGVFEGRISTSNDWPTLLPFTYTGISDNNWNRVYYLKADPEHAEGRFAIVCSVAGNNNRQLVWGQLNASLATQIKSTFVSSGDENGVLYYIGTAHDERPWSNPHTAGDITVVMSSVENGSPEVVVARDSVSDYVCYTNNIPNSWYVIDLGVGKKLILDHLTIKHGFINAEYRIKTFKVQGSNNVVSNAVADLNAATWDDLAFFSNDSRMAAMAYAVAEYDITPSDQSYRHIRILQTGVNSSNNNYLMIQELEFYGQFLKDASPAGNLKTGVQSSALRPWAGALDVSDSGSLWYAQHVGRPYYGTTTVVGFYFDIYIPPVDHPVWGSDALFKVSFYKNCLITNTTIRDKRGLAISSFSGLVTADTFPFVLHMEGGIVLLGSAMKQMLTNNVTCWDNYGWENNQWVLNAPGAKTTHATTELIGNGVTARFENGPNTPHFFADDYYTQCVLNGYIKDNASTMFYESAWYTKPVEFDAAIPVGLVIPNTKVAPTTANQTAQHWRIIALEDSLGPYAGWYIRELVFKDASGADITVGGKPASSYTFHPQYPLQNVFDKNTNSFGGEAYAKAGYWVGYSFATPVKVNSVVINLLRDGNHGPATKYAISSSSDGKRWTTLQKFTIPSVDNTNSTITLDPAQFFEGYNQLYLPIIDDPTFRRVETDVVKTLNLKIDGQPATTTYVSDSIPIIPPGVNEVFISADGLVVFNSADAGKSFTGTYAVIKD